MAIAHCYRLNGNLNDSAGSNNGSASGSITSRTTQGINGQYTFDGGFFTTANPSFTGSTWSFSLMLNPSAVNGTYGIMGQRQFGTGSIAWYIRPTGNYGVTLSGSGDYNSGSGTAIAANKRQHCALRVNGGSFECYTDKVLKHSGSVGTLNIQATGLAVGDGATGGGANMVSGSSMDEIYFRSHYPSIAELANEYAMNKGFF